MSAISTAAWRSLAAAMAAAGATGITYTFSVYSGALKHAFALQQSELDTIGTVVKCGLAGRQREATSN
jgi:hypothetical protein